MKNKIIVKNKKIIIACDHAGYDLKNYIIKKNPSLAWVDLGTNSENSVDYPDYADKLAKKIKLLSRKKLVIGVLICGSGQGIAIRANRHKHIRAAICWSEEIAKASRMHNDANVLCLGARYTEPRLAQRILKTFINTKFEGGRHERRVAKLAKKC
ncbi:MAG: ribose 5-phosphate isomerase B [Bdellovibrionales bacterium RBG_16_40_8]|nr:MAG: ribose 5-phosphate isomerase B [Bdellovibrionales bacterium RBG_16_40_8]